MVLLSVLQALALNIVRICIMIVLTPELGGLTGPEFLHKTSWIILLAALFASAVEIVLFDYFRARRQRYRNDLFPERLKPLRESPPFWYFVLTKGWLVILAIAIPLAAAGLFYKSRDYHRAEMIKGAARSLRDTHRLNRALQASHEVLDMVPQDNDWKLEHARMLVIKRDFPEALDSLGEVKPRSPQQRTEKMILESYSLMGTGRLQAAAEIVSRLPPSLREEDPRVAMILAELGLHSDEPDKVARYIRIAWEWAPNTPRIRATYPYLRTYHRWNAIVETERNSPHAYPAPAFAAMEAMMNHDLTARVADRALEAVHKWPDDMRTLEPLFFMSIRRPDRKWEDIFSRQLLRISKSVSDPRTLYGLLDKCFALARPDLAWNLLSRIEKLATDSPLIPLSAARFGNAWFIFRRRFLGFSAAHADQTTDLRPYYALGRHLSGWRETCSSIPAGDAMSETRLVGNRKQMLKRSIRLFAHREESGTLPLPLEYEYIRALEMADRLEDVVARLGTISESHPEQKEHNTILLSEIYEREADWLRVYDTLSNYFMKSDDKIQLSALLRLCHAQMELKLGIAALESARQAVDLYPEYVRAVLTYAEALSRYDSPENALFVLDNTQTAFQLPEKKLLTAELLYRTQRYTEAEDYCRANLIQTRGPDKDTRQRAFLPPAELAISWHLFSVPTASSFKSHAENLRRRVKSVEIPFLKEMFKLWLQCYESEAAAETASADLWAATGRNRIERAVALHQLAMLLTHYGKLSEARTAVSQAIGSMPGSPLLWRAMISLSGADPAVIEEARQRCPRDPEIWLADLVTRVRTRQVAGSEYTGNLEDWIHRAIREAADKNTIPAATVTRAGEFLLRTGFVEAATVAARDAQERARGLLPSHILAMKCALRKRNEKWALASTRQAIDSSLNPPVFLFENVARLTAQNEQAAYNPELLRALKQLRQKDPDNPHWAQMLGYIRFQRGGGELIDAVEQMAFAIEHQTTNRIPYAVAAEASRMLGNTDRSVDILRRGLRKRPNDIVLLNNLSYTLSFSTDGLDEAVSYIPALLEAADRAEKRKPEAGARPGTPLHLQLLDTVAVVNLRAGNIKQASRLIGRILAQTEENSAPWFRAMTVKANIALNRGEADKAEKILESILKSPGNAAPDDFLKANRLLLRSQTEAESPPPET
jgi:tetratricopeptide (TPR) repeat protein